MGDEALTVFFGTGIDDGRCSMGKLCQLDSVFLAEESFVMAAFLDIIDLNRLVALRCHA